MNHSNIKIEFLKGCDGSSVPFLKNVDNTNGIIYFDVGFPADVVSPNDYPLLPALADCVTECGWGKLDWAKAAEETALHTGGIGVNLLTMEGPDTSNARMLAEKYNWIKRDWVIFRLSMLEEKCEDALNLLKGCLCETDFSDEKRIRDILSETRNDFESSVIPDGHIFVSSRILCNKSRKTAVDEIWNGISQYFTIKKVSENSVSETVKEFRRLFAEIKAGGAIIHVTAEDSGFKKLGAILPDFVSEVKIHAPENPRDCTDSDFFALTNISGKEGSLPNFEAFVTSSQVGYAAECIPASKYEDKNSFAEEVCTHWLSNNLLWEKIRTIGGAYGAFCNAEPMSGVLVFATYRDPAAFDSCDVFENCLKEACEYDFSDDDVVRAVMGCYSHFIQPQSPKGRGASAFTRLLYGITDEDRERKILGILNTTASDLKQAFLRICKWAFSEKSLEVKKKTVICGKKMLSESGFAGKIITLPL